MIGKIVDNYSMRSVIGEGGMGIVYLAEHNQTGDQYAIKCLTPQLSKRASLKERFFHEAQAQSQLIHPNIVQVVHSFEYKEQFFIVMEYVDGKGLDEIIEDRVTLVETEIIGIFKDVLRGLNYAHSKGVVHRDMKPSNILLNNEGVAMITDFGIALIAGEKRLTKTGSNVGTAWYMSPEQIIRPKAVDHRSDVYSLGIILYEMLTGSVPFNGDTDFEIHQKHVKEPPPDIRSAAAVSTTFAAMVEKALEKDPDDRYIGCGEFLEYIEAYEREGDATRVKFCSSCGAELPLIAQYCKACGKQSRFFG